MPRNESRDSPLPEVQGDPAAVQRMAAQTLLNLRAETVARVQSLREELPAELPGVMDREDASIEDVARDMEAALAEMSSCTLHEIDRALGRLQCGGYGVCDSCGQAIAWTRLQAVPFAERCVACEEQREREAGPRAPLSSLFDRDREKPWQVTPTSGSWFHALPVRRVPGSSEGRP
jgi:DnaK suppressor protein